MLLSRFFYHRDAPPHPRKSSTSWQICMVAAAPGQPPDGVRPGGDTLSMPGAIIRSGMPERGNGGRNGGLAWA